MFRAERCVFKIKQIKKQGGNMVYPFRHFKVIYLLLCYVLLISFGLAKDKDLSKYRQSTKPRLSAGAEYILQKQKGKIKPGLKPGKSSLQKPLQSSSVETLPYIEGPVTESINYETDKTYNNNIPQYPPDNTVAVGPNHVLLGVNTAIEWYTKTDRVLQHSEGFEDFFAPNSPSYLFDPRVIYDPFDNRYVVIIDDQLDFTNINYIHLAVSVSDDPNDGLYLQKINTKTEVGGFETWLDFPALAVGPDAIYITGNMFTFNFYVYRGSRLWILDKGLYNGTDTSTVAIYDPSTESGLSSQAFTLIPSRMNAFLPVSSTNGTVGTFLYSAEWNEDDPDQDLIALFRVDDPLGALGGPYFNVQFLDPGDIHDNTAGVPLAPQKGTDVKIDFGDDRAQSLFWNGDTLLGASTVNPPTGDDAGQATVFWFAVSTGNLDSLILFQQGFIGANDITPNAAVGYPAIASNYKGDIGIGFSVSGDSIYAGSYFTIHQSTDPAGVVQPTQVMQPGVDYYVRSGSSSHTGNRWGDYSEIALDPTDEYYFWIFNQYAWTRGDYDEMTQEDGRWSTTFARVNPGSPPSAIENDLIVPPLNFSLEQNFPNPFNPMTTIKYEINTSAGNSVNVNLSVYNALGQLVKVLVNQKQQPGRHSVVFDGTGFSNGLYFYKLQIDNRPVKTRKMILLK